MIRHWIVAHDSDRLRRRNVVARRKLRPIGKLKIFCNWVCAVMTSCSVMAKRAKRAILWTSSRVSDIGEMLYLYDLNRVS